MREVRVTQALVFEPSEPVVEGPLFDVVEGVVVWRTGIRQENYPPEQWAEMNAIAEREVQALSRPAPPPSDSWMTRPVVDRAEAWREEQRAQWHDQCQRLDLIANLLRQLVATAPTSNPGA